VRAAARRGWRLRLRVVADRDDLELVLAARQPHPDGVADRAAEQRARQRRHEGDPPVRRVGLVDPDDPVAARAARARAGDGDAGAEAHRAGRLGGWAHELRARDPLLELRAPLRERGERGRALRLGQLLLRPRTLGRERVELRAQEPEPARRHVVRHVRRKWRARRHEARGLRGLLVGEGLAHGALPLRR